MKFRFAYEHLLKHKKRLEELAAREFAEAQHQVDLANQKLRLMFEQIEESRKRALDLTNEGGRKSGALAQIDEFINGHKIRIDLQRQVIRQLHLEAERTQDALIEAAKEYKTLQKLRERRLDEFKHLVKKHELKQVDELVTTRFKREENS